MKKTLYATALALGMAASSFATVAYAEAGVLTYDFIFKTADKNRDGMVTRAEFVEAMGKAYDMKMQEMKAAKDTKMMKDNAMTRDGLKQIFNDLYRGI